MLKYSEKHEWVEMSDEDRRYNWLTAPAWWGMPAKNTYDRATASLPKLLHRRMDELGIDYAVIYPTWRPGLMRFQDERDDEIRRVSCRALNAYHADIYGEYSDRMTPAAMIPMYTPEEAIDELEYSIKTLNLKVPVIASLVRRTIPKLEEQAPDLAWHVHRLDTLGLDSDYDYDPFWAKCMELGTAPACHASAFEWEAQGSISSYVYNHIGAFAKASEAFCKAPVHGRRDAPVPGPECGLPGGRGGVGLLAVRRDHLPLGEAQRPGNLEARPEHCGQRNDARAH